MYINKTVEEYIDVVGSDSSMPGGGSVAALVGALGASLTQMTMHFTKNKESFKEIDNSIREEMLKSISRVEKLNEKLKLIIDEDTKAFNSVLEAYKLPSNTEKEMEIRDEAIDKGYEKALSVPYKTFNYCYEILRNQKIFAEYGNESLITDVGIASILSYSAMESSLLNIHINLKEIKNEEYRDKVHYDIEKSFEKGKKIKDGILELINGKLE